MRRVCAPTLYCERMRPVVRISGNCGVDASRRSARTPVIMKLALAAHELADVHDRRALRSFRVARPLDAAELIELLEADAGEGRRQTRDLVHDFRGMLVMSSDSRARWTARLRDFPIGLAGHRWHGLAHARDAPLGVGERAVLFEERRSRQKHMRVTSRSRSGRDPARRRIPSRSDAAVTCCVFGSICTMSSP